MEVPLFIFTSTSIHFPYSSQKLLFKNPTELMCMIIDGNNRKSSVMTQSLKHCREFIKSFEQRGKKKKKDQNSKNYVPTMALGNIFRSVPYQRKLLFALKNFKTQTHQMHHYKSSPPCLQLELIKTALGIFSFILFIPLIEAPARLWRFLKHSISNRKINPSTTIIIKNHHQSTKYIHD